MSGRITIFDTTLRDGEQSPGCSMNPAEKLRLARQIERLGADVIEAGFPIASQGEIDSVKAVAAEIRSVRVAALARAKEADIVAAGKALAGAARPMIHTFLATSAHPSQVQAEDHPRRGPRAGRRGRAARAIHAPLTWSSRPRTPPGPTTATFSRS